MAATRRHGNQTVKCLSALHRKMPHEKAVACLLKIVLLVGRGQNRWHFE